MVVSRCVILSIALVAAQACLAKVDIVAAENFYGDVASQIGGSNVEVTSIMSNPDQDPHLFEASPSTARLLAGAGVTIANGVDYDPWMNDLLASHARSGRIDIDIGRIVHKASGDNPHLWYEPETMAALAARLEAVLSDLDSAHRASFEQRAETFDGALRSLSLKIAAMKAKYRNVSVTASEPVFGYMAEKLGLTMRNQRFQLAVMNDVEPSAGDVAQFERDLKTRQVAVMIYNSQADDPAVKRLLAIARDAGVPIVGVTETEPAGKTYQTWMSDQLDALDRALSTGNGPRLPASP